MKMPRPTMIDRLVSWLRPKAGFERMRYRVMNQAMFGPVRRTAAGTGKTTLGNWLVRRISRMEEAREREVITDRAEDLIANEPLAAAAADTYGVNIVGSGITCQSEIEAQVLGISEEQAEDVGRQFDRAMDLWSPNAGLQPRTTFSDLQYMTIHSMVRAGEYLSLARMLKKPSPDRWFSLAIQPLDPMRLATPPHKTSDPEVFDGVKLDGDGIAQAYWIADPEDWRKGYAGFGKDDYKLFPRLKGHRQVVFHDLRRTREEQYRGVSPLAPGMKAFRDISDYLDHELVAAVVSSTFTLLLETQSSVGGQMTPFNMAAGQPLESPDNAQDLVPGGIWSAPKGWKVTVPEMKRPNANFPTFLNTLVTVLASLLGLPREILLKDFTDTTYSSARAALNEAWRMFLLYRTWLVDHFCQPVRVMVCEEAYLRGLVKLPKGAPGFYEAMPYWCAAEWTGPARGTIDPEKEQAGYAQALKNFNTSYSDMAREQGKRITTIVKRRKKEQELLGDLLNGESEKQEAA